MILPFTRSIQLDDYSCGAHCAYAIVKYYGFRDTKASVLRRLRDRDGLDEDRLRRFFERKGLRPQRINRPTVEKLKRELRNGFPVLVSMDTDHWAVVYGHRPGSVWVMDPSIVRSFGARHSMSRFRKRWDGWAMAVRA